MNEQTRPNIQDAFLNAARKANVPVAIYVTNGYLINGARVISFDNYAVLVEAAGKQMLIYKHAISTVTPESPVLLDKENKANE
ncbi:MAG: RNA chaperone Hfq [Clostridia bacterium]|nr:RNA chaperone Hfq [Clostridia bacterium]